MAILVLLPDNKQLMWLLVLVYYLPELTPELQHRDAPASPIYQKSDHFREDYPRARKCALELGSFLSSRESEFGVQLAMVEGTFLNFCSRMHQVEPKIREVKNRSFHSQCRSL
jgi:hypothetical protein